MMRQGQCPRNILLSTLVHIPQKGRNSINDSNKYRSITLGSVLGTLLIIIYLKILLEKTYSMILEPSIQPHVVPLFSME